MNDLDWADVAAHGTLLAEYHRHLRRSRPRARMGGVMASWLEREHERNEDGTYTPLAMALQALSDDGCDCGTDEPGTCLGCLCEAALRSVVEEREAMRAELSARRALDGWLGDGDTTKHWRTIQHLSHGILRAQDHYAGRCEEATTHAALCAALGIEVTDG